MIQLFLPVKKQAPRLAEGFYKIDCCEWKENLPKLDFTHLQL